MLISITLCILYDDFYGQVLFPFNMPSILKLMNKWMLECCFKLQLNATYESAMYFKPHIKRTTNHAQVHVWSVVQLGCVDRTDRFRRPSLWSWTRLRAGCVSPHGFESSPRAELFLELVTRAWHTETCLTRRLLRHWSSDECFRLSLFPRIDFIESFCMIRSVRHFMWGI